MASYKIVLVGSGLAFSGLISKYAGDMLGFYAGDKETVELTSDGRQPGRTVLVVSYKTPLDMEMIPDKLLAATALFEITSPLEEDQVRTLRDMNKLPRVVQSIAALRARPGPSLDNVHIKNMPDTIIGRDRKLWEASLGQTGFYSISERSDGRFDSKYYLSIYAPVDRLTAELKENARKKVSRPVADNYTVGQFATSRQYETAKKLAMRNVNLLGKEIAAILGIDIELVPDRVALPRLNLETGEAVPQTMANPLGISLFGHLLPVNYVGQKATPVYPAVAIYVDCCHPGCGLGTPVAPLNPIDGMVWISAYKANFSATLNPATIALTLPCGSGHDAGVKPLDRSTSRYVNLCLGSLADQTIKPDHPKIARNYRAKEPIMQQLAKTYPQGNPVVLQHLFSTV
jgi:hypothetical protein